MSDPARPAAAWRRELRLLRYARPHTRAIVLLTATMIIDIGLELAQPWPLKLLVDNVLGHHRVPALVAMLPGSHGPQALAVWAAVTTIAVYALSAGSQAFYTYASLRLGQSMVVSLAGDVFAHLQRLSLRFHQRVSLGDTIARVTGDTYCVSTLVTDAVIPVAQAAVTLVAMFVVMWSLEPLLTLVALGVLPLLTLVLRYGSGSVQEAAREQRDREGEMLAAVEQTMSAVAVVQAFTRERLEERRFRALARLTAVAYLRSTFAGLRFELLAGAVTTLGTGATIYVGAELALRGRLTPGSIIVFLAYLRALYAPLDAITQTGATVQGARAEAERVLEILEAEPEVRNRPGARVLSLDGPVRYEHVHFGYDPQRPVLHDVCLEAEPGETVAVAGATGAGKTTLLSLLVRFYDPGQGNITIGGRDLRDIDLRALREQIALVLQDPFILPRTVAENIAYGRPDAPREAVEQAARAANAHEFIRRLPEGYDTELAERGSDLSGGEKQRLSLARAFLKDAPLLILDEPTSALDAVTERLVLDACDRLRAGRLTFIIAHRLTTIRRADRVIMLDNGRIVEQGAHHQLIGQGGHYAELWHERPEPVGAMGDDD